MRSTIATASLFEKAKRKTNAYKKAHQTVPFFSAVRASAGSAPPQYADSIPEKVRLCWDFFSTARARGGIGPRPLCGRERYPQSFYGTLCGYLRDNVPLRKSFNPAARSYPAGKNVEMQMEHALTRLFSDVGDHAEAVHAALLAMPSNDLKAVPQPRCWTPSTAATDWMCCFGITRNAWEPAESMSLKA